MKKYQTKFFASIWSKMNVIFVIPVSCLIGIVTKIFEKTNLNFYKIMKIKIKISSRIYWNSLLRNSTRFFL